MCLWPSVYPLWRNVYLGLLPIFWLGCLFYMSCFRGWFLVSHIVCKYFLPIYGLSFVYSFLCCEKKKKKLLSLIRSHLFIFYFHYSRRQIQKDIATIYVRECSNKKPKCQSNLMKEKLSCRNHTPWLHIILQSYSHQKVQLFLI